MKKWMSDCILGVVLLVISIVMIVYSVLLPSPRATYLLARADAYMVLVLIVLCILCVLLIARSLRMRKTSEGQEALPPIWEKLNAITAVVLLAYLFLMNRIGFILDSILAFWLLSFLYTQKSEQSKETEARSTALVVAGKTLLFAVICTVATYFIFTRILGSRLPTLR